MKIAKHVTIAAALLVTPGAAEAFEIWYGDLGVQAMQQPLFAGPGVIGGWYQRPKINNTTSIIEFIGGPASNSSFRTDTPFVGPSGTIGWVFSDGTFPAWLGNRVRVAVGGSYVTGHETRSRTSSTEPLNMIHYTAVDGRVGEIVIPAIGLTFIESVRTTYDAWQLVLRASTDYALAPNWTLSPNIGVFGGRSIERYHIADSIVVNGPAVFPHTVDERVSTSRYGLEGGATLSWRILDHLTIFGGGRVGFALVRSRMSASDCFATVAGAECPTSPGTFINVPGAIEAFFNTSAADSRNLVGLRAGAHLGATLDSGWIAATVAGFFSFDNKVPGIVNPAATEASALRTELGPARIKFGSHISYGGVVNIRISLP